MFGTPSLPQKVPNNTFAPSPYPTLKNEKNDLKLFVCEIIFMVSEFTNRIKKSMYKEQIAKHAQIFAKELLIYT